MLAGKFFSFDLLDVGGGEIRAIAFNQQATDFEPLVQIGVILQISKASLRQKKNNVRWSKQSHPSQTFKANTRKTSISFFQPLRALNPPSYPEP